MFSSPSNKAFDTDFSNFKGTLEGIGIHFDLIGNVNAHCFLIANPCDELLTTSAF